MNKLIVVGLLCAMSNFDLGQLGDVDTWDCECVGQYGQRRNLIIYLHCGSGTPLQYVESRCHIMGRTGMLLDG